MDKEILYMREGESERFYFRLGAPIKADDYLTKEKIMGVLDIPKDVEFRVTDVGEGKVQVWINKEERNEAGTINLKYFFKKILLPFTLFWIYVSVRVSGLMALSIQTNGLFYRNVGAVDYWTAFITMMVICWAIYAVSVFFFIMNDGKPN